MRAHVVGGLSVLLWACVAGAQEGPFRVERPFGGGERWALREELVTREVPVGEAEERGEVNRYVWTERAEVLQRAQGFALRLTLESFRMDARAPNVETRMTYGEQDLRTIEVGRGREVPFHRTWTFEYDPTWRLIDVSGQRETVSQLYDRMLADVGDADDGEGCSLGAWLARRGKTFVVDRWSRGFEDWQKKVVNQGGAPVRAVMARLRAGEAIQPGAELRFEAGRELPAGAVRYVGREEGGARFRVAFDVEVTEERPAPEYSFLIDDAGRLVSLESARTKIEGGRRVATEYTFALRVEQGEEESQPEQQPGIDAVEERDPVDDQIAPRRPDRAEPF